jgi:hypothetical protein
MKIKTQFYSAFGKRVSNQDQAISITNVYAEEDLGDLGELFYRMQLRSLLAIRTSSHGLTNGLILLHHCNSFHELNLIILFIQMWI